jgi:hypothetical protein
MATIEENYDQKQTSNEEQASIYNTSIRRDNPLSKFSSYTYALTLYMITPEVANHLADNGTLPDSEGWYIVAQSGGLINESEPRALTYDGELGPGKQGLNYYIDDLNIDIYLLAEDGQKTATTQTNFTFKVIEPIGFTFLTKLSAASQKINETSEVLRSGEIEARPNLYQQHYLIGIKFYGYDVDGKVIESGTLGQNQSINDKYALYERFFPVIGSKVTFRLDGKSTVYNWECQLQSLQVAFGSKRGFITSNAELSGTNVGEVIGEKQVTNKESLMGWLNDQQEVLKKEEKVDIPQVYDVEWIDEKSNYKWYQGEKIKKSLMITDQDYNKAVSGMSNASTVTESNVKISDSTKTVNSNKKLVTFGANVSIVSAIDQIIVKSGYIVEELLKYNNDRLETLTKQDNLGFLKWYSINPVSKVLGRDKITKDWSYNITYQIMPYEIPYVRSPYVSGRTRYYGPIKEYNYLFTGKNTEIISFEFQYDNSYYIITTPSTNKNNPGTAKATGHVPISASGPINDNMLSGNLVNADGIVSNVRANLYSPADQAVATMKILGDPDFLMDTIGHKIESDTASKFYGTNYSVNPYGGQVFIEIVFKVAEDYQDDGLLDVDKSNTIAFYPPEIQNRLGNSGVIYQINHVQSSFNKGKFEQVLHMTMIDPSTLLLPEAYERDDGSFDRAESDKFARQTSNLDTRSENTSPDTDSRNEPNLINISSSNNSSSSTPVNSAVDDQHLNTSKTQVAEEGRESLPLGGP